MGDSPKWVKSKRQRKKEEEKKERLNDGNNNGQATHGTHKHAWRTQAAWAKKFVGWSETSSAILKKDRFIIYKNTSKGMNFVFGEHPPNSFAPEMEFVAPADFQSTNSDKMLTIFLEALLISKPMRRHC